MKSVKIYNILLIAGLLFVCFNSQAKNPYDFKIKDKKLGYTLYYKLISNSNVEVSCKYTNGVDAQNDDYEGTMVIPSNVKYKGRTYVVSGIGNDAFSGCEGIKRVEFPTSIVTIGDRAFYKCRGLSSVFLPKDLKEIGLAAFALSGIRSVGFYGPFVETIKPLAFAMSKVENIVIKCPELKVIDECVFMDCDELQTVELPSSVLEVKSKAFADCDKLQYVNGGSRRLVEAEDAYIGTPIQAELDRIDAIGYKLYYERITDIDVYRFFDLGKIRTQLVRVKSVYLAESFSGNITIPSTVEIEGKKYYVVEIGGYAFSKCTRLKKITFPSTLMSIWESAFYGCKNLQSITLPDKLEIIESCAFKYCNSLKSVTIPSSVHKLETEAFNSCEQLTEVNIQTNNIVVWGDRIFSYSPVNKVNYAPGVQPRDDLFFGTPYYNNRMR